MNDCKHGLTTRLPVCALCVDEICQARDIWELRWRDEARRNTLLARALRGFLILAEQQGQIGIDWDTPACLDLVREAREALAASSGDERV